MFIASQVRTLHSESPQSALRLKRALTEVCFQFEADLEENNNWRELPISVISQNKTVFPWKKNTVQSLPILLGPIKI